MSKACGHDGIGNQVIKMCAEGLNESFTNLINLSSVLGQYPQSWELANLIPIFKQGDCPMSLLPSLSKIAERIVFTRLYGFLVEIGFFYFFAIWFSTRPFHH